jgi:DNA-3-methyladenine glycosylase II
MQIHTKLKELNKIEPRLFEFSAEIGLDLSKEIALPKIKVDLYSALLRAIAHQMVHGNTAKACLGRLQEACGGKNIQAKDVAKLSILDLRKCGFSENKSRAILELSEMKINKKLGSENKLSKMTNQEIINNLIHLRGIGKWTIEMFLIFSLQREDVFPVDDFGVREGFRIYKKEVTQRKPKEFTSEIIKWQGYETLISLIFWKIADKYKKIQPKK